MEISRLLSPLSGARTKALLVFRCRLVYLEPNFMTHRVMKGRLRYKLGIYGG